MAQSNGHGLSNPSSPNNQSGSNNQIVQYQSIAAQPPTTIGIYVGNEALQSTAHFRAILNRQVSESEVINVFRRIQGQVQSNAELLQDLAFDIWEIAGERDEMKRYRTENTARYNSEFSILHDGHKQAKTRRNRLDQSRRALLADYMTEAFLDVVVTEQTKRSTAVYDALVAAMRTRNQHRLSPVALFYRASQFRLQRLAGIGPYTRQNNEPTITVADIRHASALQQDGGNVNFMYSQHSDSILQSSTADVHELVPDQHSIHWLRGVQPAGIVQAYHNNGQRPERPEVQGPKPAGGPSAGAGAGAGQGGKKGGKKPGNRQPKVIPLNENPNNDSPETKRRKMDRYGPMPSDILDLISKLRTLVVVPSGSARPVRSQVKQLANPVTNPNHVDNALWRHALRKAHAISRNTQPEPLSQEDMETFNRAADNMPSVYSSVNRVADAVRSGGPPDHPNVLAYLEGIADFATVAFEAHNREYRTTGYVRRLVQRFRDYYGEGLARVNTGNEWNQGMELSASDFESFVHDEMHPGWLNGVTLMASLLAISTSLDPPVAFVVHVDHMLSYRTGRFTIDDVRLPTAPMNLVIPLHWGNHWTVATVDVTIRTIRHMDSLSLHDLGGRQGSAIEAIQRLLRDASNIFGAEPWTVDTTPSGQQPNDHDCGLWVIENARGMLEGSDHTPVVVPATRGHLAQELFEVVQMYQPRGQGATTRQLALSHIPQTVGEGFTTRGLSNSPHRASKYQPGTDIPFLPNSVILPYQSASVPLGNTNRDVSDLSDAPLGLLDTDPFTEASGRAVINTRGGQGANRGIEGGRGRGRGRGRFDGPPPQGSRRSERQKK